MSDSDLFDAVAMKTGEDSHEIRRRGFTLTGPDDTGPEPSFSVPKQAEISCGELKEGRSTLSRQGRIPALVSEGAESKFGGGIPGRDVSPSLELTLTTHTATG